MQIKICGCVFDIKESDPSGWSEGGMGRCSVKDATILINKKMAGDVKNSTAIHEVLHAIDDMNSLGLNETQVSVLANALYDVLTFCSAENINLGTLCDS
jgi:hypothetical protein